MIDTSGNQSDSTCAFCVSEDCRDEIIISLTKTYYKSQIHNENTKGYSKGANIVEHVIKFVQVLCEGHRKPMSVRPMSGTMRSLKRELQTSYSLSLFTSMFSQMFTPIFAPRIDTSGQSYRVLTKRFATINVDTTHRVQ